MEKIIGSLSPFTQLAILFISLVGVILHVRWTRKSTSLGPTFLTTLGIFFCFAGIAWGLLDFNPADIKASVPRLLEGIRTSFWASVCGIGWAISIKARVLVLGDPAPKPDGVATGATVDDLANQLSRLNRAIAGDDDSTLLTQLKLGRSDNNDRLDRLNGSFERFAQKMAEANSKALIEALSEVIRDFNVKLTEQFGDNFKQLNAAVEKLVTWQIQYESQLNALIEQETATRNSMTEASLRYAELVNRSTVFTTTAESLRGLLGALQTQSETLTVSLRSLSELVNKAATGIPTIETKIVEMTRQIEQGVRSNQDTLGAALKTSAQSIQTHNQQLTNLLTTVIETANKDLNGHLRQASDDTKKQIVALDRALEAELTKSIESLGRQLTALSQKFVQDYTPLTQQLQRLLQMGRA